MSLEQALQVNTEALNRVAQLLEISNSDRQKLMASAGAGASTPSAAGNDDGMTVAEIKEAAKSADLPTLESMLADEKAGKNRATAVKAIEEAIATAKPASEGNSGGQTDTSNAATTEATTAGTSTSTASAASDKNAQPVPAEVSPDAARQAFGAWFGETDNEQERADRRAFVEQIVAKLGANIGDLDAENRRKAIFFLRRKRGGLTVDFDAAYDFNGSPTQEVKAAAAASGADDLL